MEDKIISAQEGQLPGEVVETYRRRYAKEVVETYVRTMPGVTPTASVLPQKRSRRGLWIFLGCVLLIILLTAGVWIAGWSEGGGEPFYAIEDLEFPHQYQEVNIPTYPYGEGASLQIVRNQGKKRTPQEIYANVNPSVVAVMAQLDDESMSVGTGVIFSEDGYILTNYHVVEGGQECMIVLHNDFSFPVDYVAGDAMHDLAVLKADLTGLPVAEFGDSDLLRVGDTVYAIGNPLGMELRGTFTNGIVSAIDRDVEVDGRTMNLVQTNAALNSGNSGGPLINEYGQVVGINVIKMSSGYSSVEGLGFSIPSASVGRLVNDLLTFGEVQPEPRLGMSVLQIGEQLADEIWGVEVIEVVPGSAAAEAGMEEGDYVVRVGDMEIHTSQDVFRARRQYHLGDQMQITVWRNGQLMELYLDLQEAAE